MKRSGNRRQKKRGIERNKERGIYIETRAKRGRKLETKHEVEREREKRSSDVSTPISDNIKSRITITGEKYRLDSSLYTQDF